MLSFLEVCLNLPLQCNVCDWSISHSECLVYLDDELTGEGNMCSPHFCGAELTEDLLVDHYKWLQSSSLIIESNNWAEAAGISSPIGIWTFCFVFTESRRIRECKGLEGAGTPRWGDTGKHPSRFWIFCICCCCFLFFSPQNIKGNYVLWRFFKIYIHCTTTKV